MVISPRAQTIPGLPQAEITGAMYPRPVYQQSIIGDVYSSWEPGKKLSCLGSIACSLDIDTANWTQAFDQRLKPCFWLSSNVRKGGICNHCTPHISLHPISVLY